MGPGVDPHLYKPTPSDLSRLRRAEVVLYSGLHLEGKMAEILGQIGASRVVAAIAEVTPKDRLIHHEGDAHADPHLWFDVALWADTLPAVRDALSRARPALAGDFARRAEAAAEDLRALDAWVRAELAAVPKERRVLVTSHDAFSYFGRAYGFEVVALQGISTANEAGLADLTKLIAFVRERRLPAVFIESSVPPATLNQVSAQSGAKVGGELFSDAAGSENESIDGVPLSSYAGMIRHNVRTIVGALR
jgi:manganese/zinc/iron transport system substrate-binding protein